ncbi:DUF2865 domain-containing protein [Ochrobactrum sp. GPK 3]|uniref:DUF2865 domain-containing protein n=1 Tax=Brucella sp. 22210 TaxID=3453892 RepID=UPI0031384AFC
MIKVTALFALLVIGLTPKDTFAASCGGASANNPAVKMLQRQLSALRAIERSRGCKPGKSEGGFFNACRDVGMKIGEVQQELSLASAADRECKALASAAPRPKAVNVLSSAASARTGPAIDRSKKVPGFKNALQYCVRLSDGYYFPTPNSQFGQKGGTDAALIQCRLICDTNDMAVYINDQNEESAEMVSVQTGQTYADLTTAYDYHGDGEFKRCNWNGYVAKVASLMTVKKQPRQIADTTNPLPDTGPEKVTTVVAEVAPEQYRSAPVRDVRVVGPAFIPDIDNQALGQMRYQQSP